jgi:hypothetical protein
MEQFGNQCSTSIGVAGYVAGSGVLNVLSTSSPWPQAGTFTIQIQNSVLTLLRVTAINSSTQWAVMAESNDVNTPFGTAVIGTMLSALSMAQIQYDTRIRSGVLLPTFTVPLLANFTWDNPGSTTATLYNNEALVMYAIGASTDSLSSLLTSVTPPYTATIGFVPTMLNSNASPTTYCGLVIKSAGGLYSTFTISDNNYFVSNNYSNASTNAGSYQFLSIPFFNTFCDIRFMRIKNDGSGYRTFYYSNDGVNFLQLAQVAYNNYLAENYVGMVVDAARGTGYNLYMDVLHFQITNP